MKVEIREKADTCVEQTDYTPISLEAIYEKLKKYAWASKK